MKMIKETKTTSFQMQKVILTFLLFIPMFCNQPVTDKMIVSLEESCSYGSFCSFNLTSVTDFKWDKVFIFDEYYTDDEISKTIGIEWNGAEVWSNYRRLLFIQGEKVVHVEDFYTRNKGIQFRRLNWVDGTPASKPIAYQKSEAEFTVVLRKSSIVKSGIFFDMYPADGTLKPPKEAPKVPPKDL